MSDSTELVPVPVPVEHLQPAPATGIDVGAGYLVTLDVAIELADRMAGAATLPQSYRKSADILVAMLTAQQLRLPLMAVIQGSHVINGKVTLGAELMAAAVRGTGQLGSWAEEETKDGYRVTASRRDGSSLSVEFTDADAKAAGLTGGNWQKFRKDMLRARAVSRVCRRLFPDVLAGVYSDEEMDFDLRPVQTTLVTPAVDRDDGLADYIDAGLRLTTNEDGLTIQGWREAYSDWVDEGKANRYRHARIPEILKLAKGAIAEAVALEDSLQDDDDFDGAPSEREG